MHMWARRSRSTWPSSFWAFSWKMTLGLFCFFCRFGCHFAYSVHHQSKNCLFLFYHGYIKRLQPFSQPVCHHSQRRAYTSPGPSAPIPIPSEYVPTQSKGILLECAYAKTVSLCHEGAKNDTVVWFPPFPSRIDFFCYPASSADH